MRWKTVRTHRYRYARNQEGTELLFDLRRDPGELTNVAGSPDYDGVRHDMREELLRRWFDVERQVPYRAGRY